eukprot:TRINITY_DN15766_c0_g1_i1.p1 TRINITY_DN15766_c0_g1~~TRINITY_DN15766_c0_g1_i1.p1  ORF type:complete len:214 (-),score=60.09 TRINITY_DN15766_c0_g1_i1:105-746(-)
MCIRDSYRLIEKKLVENSADLKNKHVSRILYHLSTVKNCDDELFKDFKAKVGGALERKEFTTEELCKTLQAFHTRKLLDADMLKNAETCLIIKHEYVLVSEAAAMYRIFMQNRKVYDPVKGWEYISKCVGQLHKALEIKAIADLFEGWNDSNCPLSPKLKELLKKQALKLIKVKEKVSKPALVKIYQAAKEEQISDKYNTFAEAIYPLIKDYI